MLKSRLKGSKLLWNNVIETSARASLRVVVTALLLLGLLQISSLACGPDPPPDCGPCEEYKNGGCKPECKCCDDCEAGECVLRPIESVSADKDAVCVGCEVTFSATGDKVGCVQWWGGGDPPTGGGPSFTTKWHEQGLTYTKIVTAFCEGKNDFSWVNSPPVTVHVVDGITVDPIPVCVGCPVMLTAGTHPDGLEDQVLWDVPEGNPSSGQGDTLITTFSSVGEKTVTATCQGAGGFDTTVFVVKVDKVFEPGTGSQGPVDTCLCGDILLQASRDPAPPSGAFPPGEPHWQILSQPPCGTASLDVPAGLNTTLLQNPNAKGDYVVEAKCCSADTGDTITVRGKLPDDCSDCSTPPSVTPTINEVSGCGSCGTNCGICWPGAVGSHTYALDTPCYDNCKWYARSDSVETTVYICRSCPANPPTVACLSDVANMTQAQACAHKLNFPNDPVQYSDISTSNWCRGCVAIHEETHMNQDWIQESLNPEILDFRSYLASTPIDIDCSVGSSVDCQTAITATIQNQFDYQWEQYVNAAFVTWNAQTESDAEAAELACYQDILNALKAKCP